MNYPRINYEMTEADLSRILEACKPVPAMLIGGTLPSSPQENANRAWKELGERMGFDHMTVQPIPGKGTTFFTAVPNETHAQKEERLKREAQEKKELEIQTLRAEIEERQTRLERLTRCRAK